MKSDLNSISNKLSEENAVDCRRTANGEQLCANKQFANDEAERYHGFFALMNS